MHITESSSIVTYRCGVDEDLLVYGLGRVLEDCASFLLSVLFFSQLIVKVVHQLRVWIRKDRIQQLVETEGTNNQTNIVWLRGSISKLLEIHGHNGEARPLWFFSGHVQLNRSMGRTGRKVDLIRVVVPHTSSTRQGWGAII